MYCNFGECSKTLNINYKCGEYSKTLKMLRDDHCPPFLYFFVQKRKLLWSNMSKIWFDLSPMKVEKWETKMRTIDPNSASPSESLQKALNLKIDQMDQ